MPYIFKDAQLLQNENVPNCLCGRLTIVTTKGLIVYIGPSEAAPVPEPEDVVIDLKGALVMPGMINAHTHIGMVPFRSLADDMPNRLHRFFFPLERGFMTRQLALESAKIAMAEMLLSGITTFVDMYYYEDALAEACEQMGMRGLLGQTTTEAPNCDAKSEAESLGRAKEMLQHYKGHPLIKPVLAPHATYSVSLDAFQKCQALAAEYDTLWTTHMCEMTAEMEDFAKNHGTTPPGYFARQGLLDERLLAVHCVLAQEGDIDLFAKHGVRVAHCIGSNAKSARGVAPVPAMLEKGVPVALGTDGPSSGNTLDMFTQMKLYALLHKNHTGRRDLFPAREIVPLCTWDAAKALRMDNMIGTLEVGKQADLVVLRTGDANTIPASDPYSTLVYSAQPQNVDKVFVAGQMLVDDGKLTRFSLEGLSESFRETAKPFFAEADRILREG